MSTVAFDVYRRGTMSDRLLALLADAAAEAGIDVLTVVKGSWVPADEASADTHAGGGAADLRIWDIEYPKIEKLVCALRDRGCAAWVRDEQHGGFDPHLHLVALGEPDPSPGARDQLADYALGLDGLARHGPDYHPYHPQLVAWKWVPDVNLTDPVPLDATVAKALGLGDVVTVGELLACAGRALFVAKRADARAKAMTLKVDELLAKVDALLPPEPPAPE